MSQSRFTQLVTFDGRVNRKVYSISGLSLAAVKFAVDSYIASHFGQPWSAINYLLPAIRLSTFALHNQFSRFYLILWAIAIPFFWIGISLTVRRLRDAGQRIGWAFFFFIPVVNLIFFLYLSLASSVTEQNVDNPDFLHASTSALRRTPLLGMLAAAALGLVLEVFGANFLARYGWGLFLGVPFVTGFLSSWFFNVNGLQSRAQTVAVCAATPLLIGLFLIGFRLEGLICLVMAIPLALPFSIAGGLVAYACLQHRDRALTIPRMTACFALLPLLMFTEQATNLQPPVEPVVSSIVINAPAAVVWKNVIAFPSLAPPREWLFHTGIAYPIGAVIHGSGVGAIRYCRFSTGDFVEPITVWDENHLLAFDVTSQPPALHELGIGSITTPHIDRSYMRSQHGQFRLVAIDNEHTLLEGTTWYQDYFWPQSYWRPLSDKIIHSIHLRVLEHVKQQAELEVHPASAE